MNALVGKALEEDEEFWGGEIFKENDDDVDFSANASEGKDSFDSDFDKSEHSNDEGKDGEFSAEREVLLKEKSDKRKKVKFAIPAQKKKIKTKPKSILKKTSSQKSEEDKESNISSTSEPVVATKRSQRIALKKEDESEESDNDKKEKKQYSNNPQKNLERKREIKEKNKAFLEQHGIFGDVQEKWSELLSKDKLTPLEKIQEAALTEIINKESLSYLQDLENERVNEMVYRGRRPKGPSVKLIQDVKPGHFNSRMVFPSSDFYPKNFNTKKERRKDKFYSKNYQMNT